MSDPLLKEAETRLNSRIGAKDDFDDIFDTLHGCNPHKHRTDLTAYVLNLYLAELERGNSRNFLEYTTDFVLACMWAVGKLEERGIQINFDKNNKPPSIHRLYAQIEKHLPLLSPEEAERDRINHKLLPGMHPGLYQHLIDTRDIEVIHEDDNSSLTAMRSYDACAALTAPYDFCTHTKSHAWRYLQYHQPLYLMRNKKGRKRVFQVSLMPWEMRSDTSAPFVGERSDLNGMPLTLLGERIRTISEHYPGLAANWPQYKAYFRQAAATRLANFNRHLFSSERRKLPASLMLANSLLALGDHNNQGFGTIANCFHAHTSFSAAELESLVLYGLPALLQLQGDPRQRDLFRLAVNFPYTGAATSELQNMFADRFGRMLPDIHDLELQQWGLDIIQPLSDHGHPQALHFTENEKAFIKSVRSITATAPVSAKIGRPAGMLPPFVSKDHPPRRAHASQPLALALA